MKKLIYVFIGILAYSFVGCSAEELSADNTEESVITEETEANDTKQTFKLEPVSSSAISGEVTFTKNDDNTTTVLLKISNSSKNKHPAYIYYNSLDKGGEVALTLKAIECDCEESVTVVSKLDNGNNISFDELLDFNGHIKIHQNPDHLEVVIAQGNIGSNAK